MLEGDRVGVAVSAVPGEHDIHRRSVGAEQHTLDGQDRGAERQGEGFVRLTVTPAEVGAPDIEALRRQGLDDEAIFETIELAATFNYTSRVAIATGSRVDDSYW